MTENISFIIILEFVAPFAILSGVLLIALLKGSKKSKKGLTQLLDGVQAGEKSYQEKLLEFLKKSGMKEDKLDDVVHKFTRSRHEFFKQTLNAMNKQDAEQLEGLSGRFGVFSDLYHQLKIAATNENLGVEESEENDDESNVEANYKVVKRENKRLKAEAHVSVSALNGLFKEYASMFGEVSENKDEMTVQEILEAMKKFTKGDFKPEGVTKDLPPELQAEEAAANVDSIDNEQTEVDEMVEDDEIAVSSESNAEGMEIEVEKTSEDSGEVEPDWGDAFEETGETPDESTLEQFEQNQQEEQKKQED